MALFEIESVLHKKGIIRFTWRDLGGTYKLYRDGHLLYEGAVAAFEDDHLKQENTYDYSVERIVHGNVEDVIRLQTSAYVEQKSIENPLQTLVLTTIVSKCKVVLAWEKIQGVDSYEIYKNNILLKEVRGHYYVDREIDFNESATYRIESKRPVVKSAQRFNRSKAFISTILEQGTSLRTEPAQECFKLIKQIHSPNELLKPMERRKRIQVDEWKFRYTTFIKDEVVKNPNPFSRNYVFKGDGRDFHSEGESYRTRVDLSLCYMNPKSPMTCTKHIRETIAYDRFGKLRKSAVASYDGIVVERKDHRVGESGFLLTHDVQNPLVQAPRLNYEVRAILRKDGLVDLMGFHNQAPHHEVYLMDDMKTWKPIHLVESNGLIWLSDLTNWRYWRYSNMR